MHVQPLLPATMKRRCQHKPYRGWVYNSPRVHTDLRSHVSHVLVMVKKSSNDRPGPIQVTVVVC